MPLLGQVDGPLNKAQTTIQVQSIKPRSRYGDVSKTTINNQSINQQRAHQQGYDSIDRRLRSIKRAYTRPVPELTLVHKAYKLALSQEPVTLYATLFLMGKPGV